MNAFIEVIKDIIYRIDDEIKAFILFFIISAIFLIITVNVVHLAALVFFGFWTVAFCIAAVVSLINYFD